MFKFILDIVVVISLGVVLYLLARTLPRISEVADDTLESRIRTHRLSMYVERMDEWVKAFFEKFLRRAKVWILKLDNTVSERLNRSKKGPKELQFTEEKPEEDEKKEG